MLCDIPRLIRSTHGAEFIIAGQSLLGEDKQEEVDRPSIFTLFWILRKYIRELVNGSFKSFLVPQLNGIKER